MVDCAPNRDGVFEETELRLGLGLPGAGNEKINGKRGFEETIDLKLNLSPKEMMALDQEKSLSKPDAVKPPAK